MANGGTDEPPWLVRALMRGGWAVHVALLSFILAALWSLDRSVAALPPKHFRDYVETLRNRISQNERDIVELRALLVPQPKKDK